MTKSIRGLPLLAGLVLGGAANAAAQRTGAPPRRPTLPASADTNSAQAYNDYGLDQLRSNPRRAAAAFYWASRLDPISAEVVYAYRIALMLDDPERLRGYLRGDPRTLRGPESRRLDSLMQRALTLNPFYHAWLDDILVTEFVTRELGRSLRIDGVEASAPEISYAVNSWLRSRDSGLRPILSYSQGKFRESLDQWADEARQRPRDPMPRAWRARALYLGGNLDSARAELSTALRLARAADADSTRVFYESKSAWEFALGRIFEGLGRLDSAQAAYERTLVEELSYYQAHIRLGMLRLARGDTAAALTELSRAVLVKEDEYLPRITYAAALRLAGRHDSAETHLDRAIELEPWVALPRLLLGLERQARGNNAGAVEAFEAYLARSPRSDPDRATIQSLVETLRRGR